MTFLSFLLLLLLISKFSLIIGLAISIAVVLIVVEVIGVEEVFTPAPAVVVSALPPTSSFSNTFSIAPS